MAGVRITDMIWSRRQPRSHGSCVEACTSGRHCRSWRPGKRMSSACVKAPALVLLVCSAVAAAAASGSSTSSHQQQQFRNLLLNDERGASINNNRLDSTSLSSLLPSNSGKYSSKSSLETKYDEQSDEEHMGYLSFDESSSKDSEEFEINDELPLGWNWAMWWTYEGISGPEFWGVINPAWVMCSEGRRQSPINLDPRTLLYDPNLTPLLVDKTMVAGELVNTGHSLEWQMQEVRDDQHRDSSRDNYRDRNRGLDMTGDDGGPPTRDRHLPLPMMGAVNVSGGPLSYQYSLSRARLHYGERDIQGSEHTIDNHAFPAELQLYGHNSQLYPNLTVAASHVYGVLAVSVLIQLGDRTSPALATILEGLHKVTFGGSRASVKPLRLSDLLPSHSHYLTYEGSLTEPGCHETVTWVLPNKPLYISFSQMRSLRELRQGPSLHHRNAPLGNNFRPLQPSHHRTVRTNIDFTSTSPPETLAGRKCSMAESRFHYRANDLLRS